MTATTTKNNPGSFSKQYHFTARGILRKWIRICRQRNWRLLPKALVVDTLNFIRFVILGNAFFKSECCICGYKGPFVHMYTELRMALNSACPACDSRSRHRGLFFLYNDQILKKDTSQKVILHFAPEPVFYKLFVENPDLSYRTTDFLLEDVDYPGEDIQNLSFKDNRFNYVLCNHVIEHVPDDDRALGEISRVLVKDGVAFITIPGNFARKRTRYFDHLNYNGHYRDYGLDVLDKMKKHFTTVEAVDLSSYNVLSANGYSIRKKDMVFLCKK